MPGYAGRQARISLKGEVSDHKGIFDERGERKVFPALPGVKRESFATAMPILDVVYPIIAKYHNFYDYGGRCRL
jgi:hypothetical protein